MGSGNNQLKRKAITAGNIAKQDIVNIDKGKTVTVAQKAFQRGVQDAMRGQQAIATSGFGGNVGQRVRGLDEAKANLNIEADVAGKLLAEEEKARLRQVASGFKAVDSGLAANQMAYESALLSGGTQAGASLIDAFGRSSAQPQQRQTYGSNIAGIQSANQYDDMEKRKRMA